jgi:hypothetical protein
MVELELTRNQRRQIDKLAPHVHRLLDADVAFFEQHHDRRYRIRRAGDAEIAQAEILEDQLLLGWHGWWCWFVIVKKVPGANIRMFFGSKTAPHDLDVPDDIAEAMWKEGVWSDFIQIVDLVTPATDPAMLTDRPCKITREPKAEADPSHAFPRRRKRSAGCT